MFISNNNNPLDTNMSKMFSTYPQVESLNCKISLQNKELWQKFHELETEMIITKSGRRIFPALRVQLEYLEPNAQYCVFVELVPVSKCRYKYSSSVGWAPAGTEEAQSPKRIYLHPESPAPGHHWMSQVVSFSRLKLTNTSNPPPGHLVLSSMHRYQPRIIIVKTNDPRHITWAPHCSISFPETQFIAVTAYQNDKITKLKIDNNPFAKGFRENGQSKCKRKRRPIPDFGDESLEKEIEIVVDDEQDIKQEIKKSPSEASLSPLRLDSSDDGSERMSSPENSAPITSSNYANTSFSNSYYRYSLDMYNPYNVYNTSPYNLYTNSSSYVNPFSYYNSYYMPAAQDLSVSKEQKPKKLTDFSIKAITGLS